MTEDEAKTKWCPFARVAKAHGDEVPHTQAVFNRCDDGSGQPAWVDGALCIGSACMAWRVTKDPTLGWHSEERDRWQEQNGRFVPSGFCGLSGASQ